MDCKLIRTDYLETGIFGRLQDKTGAHLAYTLEHAYMNADKWCPKLPEGVYTCERGMHRLSHMISDFTTFEVTHVPSHTGILFHSGNINADSSGCILLGREIKEVRGIKTSLVKSLVTFIEFRDMTQLNCKQFTLTVISAGSLQAPIDDKTPLLTPSSIPLVEELP